MGQIVHQIHVTDLHESTDVNGNFGKYWRIIVANKKIHFLSQSFVVVYNCWYTGLYKFIDLYLCVPVQCLLLLCSGSCHLVLSLPVCVDIFLSGKNASLFRSVQD